MAARMFVHSVLAAENETHTSAWTRQAGHATIPPTYHTLHWPHLQDAASEGEASSEALRLQLLSREASITDLQSELAALQAAVGDAKAAADAATRTAEQRQVTKAHP